MIKYTNLTSLIKDRINEVCRCFKIVESIIQEVKNYLLFLLLYLYELFIMRCRIM